MKDLYKRLGVSPGVARALLSEAIERHPDTALKASAREVLLSERREAYDNALAQLRRIGQLRANLGLAHTELWQQTQSGDFDVSARGHQSQLQALRDDIQRNQQTHAESGSAPRRPRWNTALRALAIFAGLGVWIWYLLASNGPVNESRTTRSGDAATESVTHQSTADGATKPPPQFVYDEVELDQVNREARTSTLGPPIEMPQTGVVFRAQRSKKAWPELRVKSGNRAGNFFVKVLLDGTTREVAHLFVRSGEVASITLPPGEYKVRYASGAQWFGEKEWFGPKTMAAEGVDAIELRVIKSATGYQLLGGELTLEKQVDGNFADHAISIENF